MIAAGFSYQVVVAHNGCLQMEVTVHGEMSHAAIPDSWNRCAAGGHPHIECAVCAEHAVPAGPLPRGGHHHPYLNVGLIAGGTNTNVIPGKVVLKLDRRMIPEEDPTQVEASIRATIEAAAQFPPAARQGGARGHPPPAAGTRHGAAARQRAAGGRPAAARPGRVWRADFRLWARRFTPTCGCTASAAFRA